MNDSGICLSTIFPNLVFQVPGELEFLFPQPDVGKNHVLFVLGQTCAVIDMNHCVKDPSVSICRNRQSVFRTVVDSTSQLAYSSFFSFGDLSQGCESRDRIQLFFFFWFSRYPYTSTISLNNSFITSFPQTKLSITYTLPLSGVIISQRVFSNRS